jgi:hypothetical protein
VKSLAVIPCIVIVILLVFEVGAVLAMGREVIFKNGDFSLYGTLSIPGGTKEKKPAIILVHGSGPNDRDETLEIGGVVVKPFKDLANYLVNSGFVVLRYDKRSFTLRQMGVSKNAFDAVLPGDFIKDAQAAIDFLKEQPEIDPDRIIIVGHSQGASFAPKIVQGKSVAGAVLIAPGLLQFRDALIYQANYQIQVYEKMNTGGEFDQDILQMKAFLREVEQTFAMIDNGIFPSGGYVVGVTLAFYSQLQELTKNIKDDILEAKPPILIINGTKDMLCPVELLREWESYLKIKPNLEVVYIDNMVHQMYRADTGKFETVLPEDIARWANRIF